MFGTSFPTVGHRHALSQLDALGLDDEIASALMGGNAAGFFPRIRELA